jgi:hypothetical protein
MHRICNLPSITIEVDNYALLKSLPTSPVHDSIHAQGINVQDSNLKQHLKLISTFADEEVPAWSRGRRPNASCREQGAQPPAHGPVAGEHVYGWGRRAPLDLRTADLVPAHEVMVANPLPPRVMSTRWIWKRKAKERNESERRGDR